MDKAEIIQHADIEEVKEKSEDFEKDSDDMENIELILHEEDFLDLNIADNISLILGTDSFFAA